MANIANTLNPNPMMPDLGQAPLPNVQLGMDAMPSSAASLPSLPEVHPMVRTLSPLEQNIDSDQQRLQKVRFAQANPYGSANNHPGTLGKIAHVLSVAGNIAGDIVAPGVTANIPGSQLNMQMEGNSLTHRLNAEQQEESQNAGRDATTQETQLANAAEPEKTKLGNELTQSTIAKNNEEAQPKPPSLATAYAHRVNELIAAGQDPSKDPVVQHLQDAMTSVQPGANKPDAAPKTIQIEQGGKPHQMGWDPKTSKYDIDEGESGEKPPVVNVNEGHKEALQQKQQVFKTYQPVMDSAERFNVMAKNYEDAVKNHDQQAMLSLLYNHMGMTMGLQKGARMTQALIREAQESQPWLRNIQAKFDKDGYLSGVVLSPKQMREMVSNAQGRYQEDVTKARSEGSYLGASDDGPDRTPNPSTINYYINLAHGDPAKAKQLAAHDGWTVK